MAFYSRPIEMPKTMRDGLCNFVQLIINDIEGGDSREGLLRAVDLLNDLQSGTYNGAMTDHAAMTAADKGARAAIAAAEKGKAEMIARAYEEGIAAGRAAHRAEVIERLGLAA